MLLKEVTDIQEDFGQVESRDRCTAEHNFERVNFWSTVYLIVLISVGITQVRVEIFEFHACQTELICRLKLNSPKYRFYW